MNSEFSQPTFFPKYVLMDIEPRLNYISGENFEYRTANTSQEARLDISARGVWTKYQRAFFEVRVFDPLAKRYKVESLEQSYRSNENEKKRFYNERVLEVENGTFNPLVFSVYGGMGK